MVEVVGSGDARLSVVDCQIGDDDDVYGGKRLASSTVVVAAVGGGFAAVMVDGRRSVRVRRCCSDGRSVVFVAVVCCWCAERLQVPR